MQATLFIEIFLLVMLRYFISRTLVAIGIAEYMAIILSILIALSLWFCWLVLRRRLISLISAQKRK